MGRDFCVSVRTLRTAAICFLIPLVLRTRWCRVDKHRFLVGDVVGRLAMLVYTLPSGLTLLPLGEASRFHSTISGFWLIRVSDFSRINFHLPYFPSGLRRFLPGRLPVDQAVSHPVAELRPTDTRVSTGNHHRVCGKIHPSHHPGGCGD